MVKTKRKPIDFFRQGNSKLGKDTLIFNLQSATDCISDKLGYCKVSKICYAKRPERDMRKRYVLPFRRAQEKYWDSVTTLEFARTVLTKAKRSRVHEVRFLRINEAGDFRGQPDFDKVSQIADLLIPSGIVVYCYTCRQDLNFKGRSKNLVVNGSNFMVDNEYHVVLNGKRGRNRCLNDCRGCMKCKRKTGKTIYQVIH